MNIQTRIYWSVALFLAVSTMAGCSPDNGNQAPASAISAAPPVAPAEDPSQTEDAVHELAGTSWRLVKIMGMDDSVAEPEDRSLYTLEFSTDGQASLLADCNRGTGSWTSESGPKLEFGPIAATMAMCPPGSLADKYLAEFQWVRSYVMDDGHLFLATMADGSIIEFEPADIPNN
jgi:heat shock protein HslJ